MSELLLPRRGFFRVLSGAIAAPMIARAELLMPIRAIILPEEEKYFLGMRNGLLTVDMITREAVRLWKNSAIRIARMEEEEALQGALGGQLRVRLPSDL